LESGDKRESKAERNLQVFWLVFHTSHVCLFQLLLIILCGLDT
jgi:hypothetical protein